MCGRFTLRSPTKVLREFFPLLEIPEVQPHYNIAPSQAVLAIRQLPQSARPELVQVRWGLVPWWAEDPKIGNRMINARCESAAERPAFRDAFRQRRCLIPADGFFEWKKTEGRKQPFYIRRKDEKPFAFAGLWERWRKGDEPLESCTILTTDANDLVRPLHDRMPVILAPADYERWLDPTCHEPAQVQELLRPCLESEFVSYPVATRVNDVKNEDAGCIAPVNEGEHLQRLW